MAKKQTPLILFYFINFFLHFFEMFFLIFSLYFIINGISEVLELFVNYKPVLN
jgi:hypothetical protein